MSDRVTPDTRSGSKSSGGGGRVPALELGAVAAVFASIVGSAGAYATLPAQLRIHWTLGMGPYYGPEFAPKLVVLTLFPVLVTAGALVGWWGTARLRDVAELDAVRPYDAAVVLGVLVLLLAGQFGLILANL